MSMLIRNLEKQVPKHMNTDMCVAEDFIPFLSAKERACRFNQKTRKKTRTNKVNESNGHMFLLCACTVHVYFSLCTIRAFFSS